MFMLILEFSLIKTSNVVVVHNLVRNCYRIS